MFNEEAIAIIPNLLQKIKRRDHFPVHFIKSLLITLTPKPDKDSTKKKTADPYPS